MVGVLTLQYQLSAWLLISPTVRTWTWCCAFPIPCPGFHGAKLTMNRLIACIFSHGMVFLLRLVCSWSTYIFCWPCKRKKIQQWIMVQLGLFFMVPFYINLALIQLKKRKEGFVLWPEKASVSFIDSQLWSKYSWL